MENNKKKKIRIAVIIAAVAAVIAAVIIAVSANMNYIQNSILYSVMPDSVEYEVTDSNNDSHTITVYKRKNTDFSSKDAKHNALAYYEFYYYDNDGNEVSTTGDKNITYDGVSNGMPYLMFMFQSLEKVNQIKNIAKIVAAVVVIAIIIAVLVLSFFLWSKKQDREKEEKFGHKNKVRQKK